MFVPCVSPCELVSLSFHPVYATCTVAGSAGQASLPGKAPP